jgi:hypothetical protein
MLLPVVRVSMDVRGLAALGLQRKDKLGRPETRGPLLFEAAAQTVSMSAHGRVDMPEIELEAVLALSGYR